MIRFIFFVLFFVSLSWSFSGSGDCASVLSDYATLTSRSIWVPPSLNGNCVIRDSKDFPLILKTSGHTYKEVGSSIIVKPIIPLPEKLPAPWRASVVSYKVSFLFLNLSNTLDCGLKLDDVLASFHNLDFGFSVAGSLGCPALADDGSFSFSTVATFRENWSYTHGQEVQRPNSTITSSTGAVTTSYNYISTGLTLDLFQDSLSVSYSLRYVAPNSGAVTTSKGVVSELIQADVFDYLDEERKLWIIPIGKYRHNYTYRLIVRFEKL